MPRPRKAEKEATPPSELEETLLHANKQYGASTTRRGSTYVQPDRIPTGIFVLDFALLGGFSENRTSMILGNRHAGKSMLSSLLIGNCQKLRPEQTCVLLDIEGTFEPSYAQSLGVDCDRLIVVEPDTGEIAVDMAEAVLSSKETSLLVVDSIAALAPFKELDSSAEDAHVGLQARLVGGMVRKITSLLLKERKRGHYVTPLYINQFRSLIGGFQKFGDPTSIPGGRALEYCTSLQIVLRNQEKIGKNSVGSDTVLTNEHSYTIKKNKMNNGTRTGEFRLAREEGAIEGVARGEIDNAPTLLTYAKRFTVYTGAGSSQHLEFLQHKYKFGKQDECIQALREDRQLAWDLRNYLIAAEAKRQGMADEFCQRILDTPSVLQEYAPSSHEATGIAEKKEAVNE